MIRRCMFTLTLLALAVFSALAMPKHNDNTNHRYTMTLYDLLAPDDTETLVKMGFSPLQRQVLADGKRMEEYIAFT